MWQDARMLRRFAGGLRRFYSEPAGPEEARRILTDSIPARQDSFLRLMRRAVFDWSPSPYRVLLRHAGVTNGDLEALVRRDGIETALERLLDAGVYLTLDEFKGKAAVKRPGLELPMTDAACDNPLLTRHFEVGTGGSSAAPRRLTIDLDLLRFETALHVAFLESAGMREAPMALWRPVPPGSAGLKRALQHTRAGLRLERWFTQEPFSLWRPTTKSWAVTMTALAGSRMARKPIPVPETTPLTEAVRVAEWAAGVVSSARTPHVDTTVSGGVRVLRAARAAGLDLPGAFFRLGGEAFTSERARLFLGAGCRAVAHFSISETGPVAQACVRGEHPDEAHLIHSKLALVTRAGVGGIAAPDGTAPLFLTTLLEATPKILLNVEIGDTAIRAQRDCGCLFERLGFHTHLHTIRSYEKLTSAGMHFTYQSLLRAIEEALPARFGGDPTDYQFAEWDEDGLPVVALRAHPRLGPIEEADLQSAVLDALGRHSPADRMMARVWRQSGFPRLERRAPATTAVGKVPLLDQSRRSD